MDLPLSQEVCCKSTRTFKVRWAKYDKNECQKFFSHHCHIRLSGRYVLSSEYPSHIIQESSLMIKWDYPRIFSSIFSLLLMLPQQLYVQLPQYTHQYEHQSLWKKRRKIINFTAWSKKLFVYHYPLNISVDHPIKRFVIISHNNLLTPSSTHAEDLKKGSWPVQPAKTAVFNFLTPCYCGCLPLSHWNSILMA